MNRLPPFPRARRTQAPSSSSRPAAPGRARAWPRAAAGLRPMLAGYLAALVATLWVGGCERAAPGSDGAALQRETMSRSDADARPGAAAAQAGAAQAPTLAVADAGAGMRYLTDAAGSALYALDGDDNGSRCDARCSEVWPPYASDAVRPSASADIDSGRIGRIARPDGRSQLSYAGRPLYRYAADQGQGRTAGHDVRDRWGHWRLLTPSGEPLQGKPADAAGSNSP